MNIADFIAEAKANGTLIAIHCEWQKKDKFLCGFVEAIRGEEFKVRFVNLNGQPGRSGDEADWIGLHEVDWAESDTPYLKALLKMHEEYERFTDLKPAKWKTGAKAMKKTLVACHADSSICSIRYANSEHYHIKVETVDKIWLTARLLGDYGDDEGRITIRLDTLKGVRVGGIDEATVEFLVKG